VAAHNEPTGFPINFPANVGTMIDADLARFQQCATKNASAS